MGTIQDQINTLRHAIATAETQIDSLTKQLCQISGTLFNDTDANGTRGSGETATGTRKILLQPGNITVSSDANGNYTIANLDPGTYTLTRPDFPPGYRLSNPTTPGGNTISVTLAAGEHQTIDIGTTDRQVEHPANQPAVLSPLNITQIGADTSDTPHHGWAAIGACITLSIDAKDEPTAIATVAKANALQLTHLRSFGPACRVGGALDNGYANQVRRLTSRCLRVVVTHGAPEADPTHTTYDENDWKRYFDNVAKARNNDRLYEIELQNEFNLAHYWPLGGGATLNAAAITKMMSVVKIARASLGPAATIIGPSIGWDAGVGPHLQYQEALLDAGLLDFVTAINTHLYFGNAQQVKDVLGQYRQWVGASRAIYCTEANCATSIATYAATAPASINAMRSAGIVPMIYRLVPRGDNAWDDRCLFDSKGQKNQTVAGAWF